MNPPIILTHTKVCTYIIIMNTHTEKAIDYTENTDKKRQTYTVQLSPF